MHAWAGVRATARASTAFTSTFVPLVTSSGSASSASLCDRPSTHGMNTIAVGTWRLTSHAGRDIRGARDFLARGGGLSPDAAVRAARAHALFVERRLSPGGAADLLAAALWVERVERLDDAGGR